MITSSNIIMGCSLSNTLNLEDIFLFSPLLPVDFYYPKNNKSKQDKIPYFGVEGCIIGMRFKNLIRGCREGGCIKNHIFLDLQVCQKNLHVKVSKQKFQVHGCLDENMGKKALLTLLELFTNSYNNMEKFTSLPYKIKKNTTKYALKLFKGDNNTLIQFYDKDINTVENNIDMDSLNYLSSFTSEFNTYDDYKNHIILMYNHENIIYNKVEITTFQIYNNVFKYKIDNWKPTSLIQLCNFFHSKNYKTLYHNWKSSKSLKVVIELSEEEKQQNVSKIQMHRFEITSNGSIQQHSPTTTEFSNISRLKILKELELFLTSNS
jgi:hypothetical protein